MQINLHRPQPVEKGNQKMAFFSQSREKSGIIGTGDEDAYEEYREQKPS